MISLLSSFQSLRAFIILIHYIRNFYLFGYFLIKLIPLLENLDLLEQMKRHDYEVEHLVQKTQILLEYY